MRRYFFHFFFLIPAMYDWKFIQNRDQWVVDMITIHRFLSHLWLENSPLGQTFRGLFGFRFWNPENRATSAKLTRNWVTSSSINLPCSTRQRAFRTFNSSWTWRQTLGTTTTHLFHLTTTTNSSRPASLQGKSKQNQAKTSSVWSPVSLYKT